MSNKNGLNTLLIGCGAHVKRSYLPALQAIRNKLGVSLDIVGIVELESQKSIVADVVTQLPKDVDWVFTQPFESNDNIPPDLEARLDNLVQTRAISAVIIATVPRVHVAYALWAMRRGLHILMDKPISTRKNAAISLAEAKGLQKDFELLSANRDIAKAFIVSAQRRYEPGFQYALEQVEYVAGKYGMPITSMQATHADGQWRLPEEIINEDYHGYNAGYGIISHGGYHIADICSTMIQSAAKLANKPFDQVGAFSSFVQPAALLRQQTYSDLRHVFGAAYDKTISQSESAVEKQYKDYGEVDTTSLVTFFSNDVPYSNLTINLLHNSFSRRSWLTPNLDLYNGNGRVRHEYYNIEQGPYQNIQLHSYHVEQEHLISNDRDYELGGNEHFDILVFRNSDILGGKPLQIIRPHQLKKTAEGLNTVEQAKQDIVQEFIEVVLGKRLSSQTKSDLSSHALTVALCSLMYQSGINRKETTMHYDSSSSSSARIS